MSKTEKFWWGVAMVLYIGLIGIIVYASLKYPQTTPVEHMGYW